MVLLIVLYIVMSLCIALILRWIAKSSAVNIPKTLGYLEKPLKQ